MFELFQKSEAVGIGHPEFCDLEWVSSEVEEIWQPRLERIRQCRMELQYTTIGLGHRECSWMIVPPEAYDGFVERMSRLSLVVHKVFRALRTFGYNAKTIRATVNDDYVYWVVVGRDDVVCGTFIDAFGAGDDRAMGYLLGYPICCRMFFERFWREDRLIDSTWPMASGLVTTTKARKAMVSLRGDYRCNPLLRWIGVGLAWHLMCSENCASTIKISREFEAKAIECGYGEEMNWSRTLLEMETKWSSAGGVATVETDLFCIRCSTDESTAGRVVLFQHIDPLGAEGQAVADSSQQVSLQGILTVAPEEQDWYYRDNGFYSRRVMELKYHQPLLDAANEVLTDTPGNVLDLGCGNGVLLRALLSSFPQKIPFGVDIEERLILHAGVLLPNHRGNFVTGNLFDVCNLPSGRRYDLAFLCCERLDEVSRSEARAFLELLRPLVERLIFYTYLNHREGERNLRRVASELNIELCPFGRMRNWVYIARV